MNIRELFVRIVKYKIENGTFNTTLFPDPKDDTLTDPSAINFYSKEAADLISAILTKNQNYIIKKYIDNNYEEGTTQFQDGSTEKIRRGYSKVSSPIH